MPPPEFELRPGVSNINQWYPERPKWSVWNKTRKIVLERDNYSCISCGHRAFKWMHVHHIEESDSNDPKDLATMCVACHAVMHIGLNLSYGVIEIWKSPITQVEIVRRTRDGIRHGKTLQEINSEFNLKRGKRDPNSCEWANSLLKSMEYDPRAELKKPLCAVFCNLKKWQIDQ